MIKKWSKHEPKDIYLTEEIIIGMLLEVGLRTIITVTSGTFWIWVIFLPSFYLLLGTVAGMNIKKK